LREVTLIADYFVICTGTSERQLKAIVERVRTNIKQDYGIIPEHVEGDGRSGWTLLDYSSVVVHVFSEELRRYYDLEGFWQEAKVLLRIQ
jgi:ribosome-associated protein